MKLCKNIAGWIVGSWEEVGVGVGRLRPQLRHPEGGKWELQRRRDDDSGGALGKAELQVYS